MKFTYGKRDWNTLRRGQENCYLLANRKGGYSSLSMVGSSSRNEHVLFMASVKAPNNWVQFVSNLEEIIRIDDRETTLRSQEYVGYTKNKEGFRYLDGFSLEHYPAWNYLVHGVSIEKKVVMKYEENLVLVSYEMENHSGKNTEVILKPWMRFVPKGSMPQKGQKAEVSADRIVSGGYTLFYKTDAMVRKTDTLWEEDLYFEDDAKDERDAIGTQFSDHEYYIRMKPMEKRSAYILYSLNEISDHPDEIILEERKRKESLSEASGMKSDLGRQLAIAADAFVVDRESVSGRTIIAGYPFFGDWGRDTMIAVMGCCIASGRKKDTESIFRSFMKYMKNGIMPNMFPEGEQEPMYNTVDASLLFIYAVYEYYQEFRDLEFVREAMPKMMEIIDWYRKGTDFHIRMEEDHLLSAGSGLEQVTWMDIRVYDYLPTPRHGKPVEINAYWYNDLKVMEYFLELMEMGSGQEYRALAKRVRDSFVQQFWNHEQGCLKDVVSGTESDYQVRCNQIWAVSVPFGMLDREKERKVVEKVYTKLYTPYGLRSLSPDDPEYRPSYGGSLWDRDTAYHQGTVWAFPLGGYYLAYLKVNDYSRGAKEKVMKDMGLLEGTLREGCIGQIAEIFDGEKPSGSKGCFAQAWSVGELMRALKQAEQQE
ncbi:amylo-alpha-1,6-glucosidase [Proteiniclasticum sp. C24MP]|uniref:amylo-alpha-1,6-glucosidase n=1 Tax=Proteiniclasticum sp. C24MP TaxID=3374101 RepID=UPI0037545432